VVTFAFQVLRELAGRRRFARALQPAHHDDGRARLDHVNARVDRAEQVEQLVVDDLHHQLPRLEALDDLLADGLLHDVVHEVVDDLEVDVGLEQRGADLAHRFADVFFGDLSTPGKAAEDAGEFFSECVEHAVFVLIPGTICPRDGTPALAADNCTVDDETCLASRAAR
jgi:hypothetical protein